MKLLMTTEKLDRNDAIFAFSHLWVKTIAEQVETLIVIALSVGEYDLPANVKVYSLGKEKNVSKIKYILSFYKMIWKERKNYDTVFVHMNQVYVILGGLFWKLFNKKIELWYTHRKVSLSLKWAITLADVVFTAVGESMNVVTTKKRVVGHGIDTKSYLSEDRKKVFSNEKIIITSIGRITPIKNLETLIKAAKILLDKKLDLELHLIGPEVNSADIKYRYELDELVKNLELEERILFLGGKKPEELKEELWQSDISVNLCPTGGLDKAVIESICAGLHTYVANTAFKKYFREFSDDYLFEYKNENDLADKIEKMLNLPKQRSQEKLDILQKRFMENFDIKALIQNILDLLKK